MDEVAVLFCFVGFEAVEALLLGLGKLERPGDGRAAEFAVFAATVVERTGAGGAFEAHATQGSGILYGDDYKLP